MPHILWACKKLIRVLTDKSKYSRLSGNLKFCIELRMKFREVNKFTKFEQNKCLRPYSDMNTKQRTKAERQNQETRSNCMN